MRAVSKRYLQAAMAASLLGFAPGAFAYLDPSTGSMILSAIVGIVATLSLAVKTYWYKLKSFFSGKQNDSQAESVSADSVNVSGEAAPSETEERNV